MPVAKCVCGAELLDGYMRCAYCQALFDVSDDDIAAERDAMHHYEQPVSQGSAQVEKMHQPLRRWYGKDKRNER